MGQLISHYSIHNAMSVMEAGPEHPDYDTAWEVLARSQNPLIQEAFRLAIEEVFGPLPTPTGYNDDGQPFWLTTVIASHLGMSVDEVDEVAEEAVDRWGDQAGVMDSAELNRIQ
ncbi:MAG: hypothetical protein HQL54_02710 [Magnetococcales bacterium]|nr:hypothetical protein [Magnetococcales bacterium]